MRIDANDENDRGFRVVAKPTGDLVRFTVEADTDAGTVSRYETDERGFLIHKDGKPVMYTERMSFRIIHVSAPGVVIGETPE